MEAFIAAGASIVVAILSLVGVIITNNNSNKKIETKLDKQQAVMDCKIDELTREVREHNNFARRMPVVEEQIKVITIPESLTIKDLVEEQIKVINHRIQDLEKLQE